MRGEHCQPDTRHLEAQSLGLHRIVAGFLYRARFLHVSGDDFVAPIEALQVIKALYRRGATGEGEFTSPSTITTHKVIDAGSSHAEYFQQSPDVDLGVD